jgi:hypothetical protein
MSEYPRRERYDDRDRGRYSRGTGNYRDATFDRRQGPKEPYQDRERGEFQDDRARGYRPDDRGGQIRSWDSADSRKHSPSRDGKRADDVLEAGNPNSQIIFRGLEKDITESDVSDFYT